MEQQKPFYNQPETEEKTTRYRGIGKVLETLRVNSGRSVKALADEIGVSVGSVVRWESGEVLPQDSNIRKLAALYETSEENLLMGMTFLDETEVVETGFGRAGAIPLEKDWTENSIRQSFSLHREIMGFGETPIEPATAEYQINLKPGGCLSLHIIKTEQLYVLEGEEVRNLAEFLREANL